MIDEAAMERTRRRKLCEAPVDEGYAFLLAIGHGLQLLDDADAAPKVISIGDHGWRLRREVIADGSIEVIATYQAR